MSGFQSYLIVAPTFQLARQETKKLAKTFGIDIEKASPDVFFVTPPKEEITIGQIRGLIGHIFQKPFKYKNKFVVIEQADTAAQEAQNSLLKILEEPPEHAIIVLEAKNKALLLPTILSRVITRFNLDQDTPQLRLNLVLGQDLEAALLQISAVVNPQEFLDNQIMALAELLIKTSQKGRSLSKGQGASLTGIATAIEACARAKEMIVANVNPNFVLANLVFTTNSASK